MQTHPQAHTMSYMYGLKTPKGDINLRDHELRRLLSLARMGIEASKERGTMSQTDVALEAILNGPRARF